LDATNLQDIRAFVAVAETGSISSRAADCVQICDALRHWHFNAHAEHALWRSD
jgi:hypothetical protein